MPEVKPPYKVTGEGRVEVDTNALVYGRRAEVKPLSAEEIEDLRSHQYWWMKRWLATIDAKDAEIARLKGLLEALAPENGIERESYSGGDSCVWCGRRPGKCVAGECPWVDARQALAAISPDQERQS